MLKKFLPWLQSQLNHKRQQSEKPQLNSSQVSEVNQGINLIEGTLVVAYDKDALRKRVRFYNAVVLFTAITFFITWSLNFLIDRKINALYSEQQALISAYNTNEPVYKELSLLQEQLRLYKNTLTSDAISTYMDSAYIFEKFNLLLDSFSLDRDIFSINLETADILGFAALLDTYIKDPKIDYITIHSANLNKETQTYKVEMEVHFK